MNNKLLFLAGLIGATFSLSATAQTTVADSAQVAGLHELTIGGSGSSNNDLDDSFGNVDFSYGMFTGPRSEWLIRQSIGYTNPDDGDNGWNGSTRLAYDWHFSPDANIRPFLGVNLGGIYGNNVNDTWTAGIEAGAKMFVRPRTFLFLLTSYDWFFDHSDDIDDTFGDGRFHWSLGVGYQF